MQGFYSRCDAAIMEFFVDGPRSSLLEGFRMCRSWKMWNFFAGFAAVAASCTAASELGRAHAAMKQSDRCA
jgi:hypothetical protein